jgi:hypothetical protein
MAGRQEPNGGGGVSKDVDWFGADVGGETWDFFKGGGEREGSGAERRSLGGASFEI